MPEALIRALQEAVGVDEYIVSARQTQALRRELSGEMAEDQKQGMELEAKVFIDRELGRGQSHFSVTPGAQLRSLIEDAAARALGGLGPAWRLSPPSAPARLQLADTEWAENLSRSVDLLIEKFQAHLPSAMRLLQGSIQLELVNTRTIMSNGFDNQFGSTSALIQAQLQASGGSVVTIEIHARRQEDLRWQALFADAERRSLSGSAAVENEPGEYDLLLLSSAYTPQSASDFGLWTPLAYQCDAALAANGFARYQVGQEILAKPARGDSLSLRSDGARDFGPRSAPFDAEGQGIRRFSLVEKGRAAGQSVNYRDSARQKTMANGGVRNLVMDSGASSLSELSVPGERPLLLVHSLSDLHAEARGGLCLRVTGSQRLEQDAEGKTQSRESRGGVLCGNLYEWLQDARFSSERRDLLWFDGPEAIRFNKVHLRA